MAGFESPFDKHNTEDAAQIRQKLGLSPEATGEEVEEAIEVRKKTDEVNKESEIKMEEKDLEFQNQTVEYINDILDADNNASEYATRLMDALAGIDTPEAWQTRDRIAKEYKFSNVKSMSSSIAGLKSERAWEERKKMRDGNNLASAVRSLVGIADGRDPFDGEDLRDLIAKDTSISRKDRLAALLISYGGVDTEQSWELRGKIMDDLESGSYNDHLAQLLAKSLIGLYSGPTVRTQNRLFHEMKKARPGEILSLNYEAPDDLSLFSLAESLVGNETPEARVMRKELSHGNDGEEHLLISIGGLNFPEYENIRNDVFQKLARNNINNDVNRPLVGTNERSADVNSKRGEIISALLDSLRGVDSHRAEGLRKSLETNGINKTRIAQSMYGGPVMVAARARFKAEI